MWHARRGPEGGIGVPIMVDGKVTGAVGVTGDQDEQCAKAGLM